MFITDNVPERKCKCDGKLKKNKILCFKAGTNENETEYITFKYFTLVANKSSYVNKMVY
jgi:hypothetical protein